MSSCNWFRHLPDGRYRRMLLSITLSDIHLLYTLMITFKPSKCNTIQCHNYCYRRWQRGEEKIHAPSRQVHDDKKETQMFLNIFIRKQRPQSIIVGDIFNTWPYNYMDLFSFPIRNKIITNRNIFAVAFLHFV